MACSPVEILSFDMDTLSHSCHNHVTVADKSGCLFTPIEIPWYMLTC